MSAGVISEAVGLRIDVPHNILPSIRPKLAVGVLYAGIALNVAWIGTVGWFSLHLMGWA